MQITPTSAPETAAKPKVLKRPAQFSRKADAPSDIQAIPPLPLERRGGERRMQPLAIRLPSMPWQEDGRFGLMLILALTVVNGILALTLRHTPATPELHQPAPVITMRSDTPAMPSMNRTEKSAITLYSEPATLEDSAQRMNLDSLSKNDNDFSIPAGDSPAPVARALDAREP